MTIVTTTWRQLVQRRLWPVALLLLGALVAVPFVLAKSPEPVAAPPAAPGHRAVADTASADPIVQPVSDEEPIPTRRVLGVRHDPFADSVHPKPAKKSSTTASSHSASSPSSTGASATGGSSPSTSFAPTTTTPQAPTTPAVPMTTVPAKSIDIRFGSGEGGDDVTRMTVRRLEALPSQDEPLLVYLGAKRDGKTAIFMLDSSLTATGDGNCKPVATCETIELKAGETEFFDAKDDTGAVTGQYRLDVIKIHKHATKVPVTSVDSGSSGSSTTVTASSATAGRRALRARIAKSGPLPYAYDARSGTLRRR